MSRARRARPEALSEQDQARVKRAAEMGREAFAAGDEAGIPACNRALMDMVCNGPVGQPATVPALKAYIRAHTAARLAAPVPELAADPSPSAAADEDLVRLGFGVA